ncbi:putative pentatricopeptide repeat-containing protein At3g25970 [Amaranthus tricolor]|uniref:putative pentatricopeptide repeat-containing protein At3g25970 n=1 Tax=Amaranthus tricolor TaxID=29722 RepID=UPI00258C3997|nr:putative pentatricopeptide repeat-containing protein At3g25970 [Amaranthus tricolor]XP_057521423.1 putative pentatricopeptide repeat-containing protein At3g25970 [Amaranthus tricolor]XP_057521424.1 putative pentatricopeptide repeat-containing protein At3g25970 [Amaranthus tricolor]XP_057521425.1 putative pentatricopeptide repeat-containing protein At3g25970 [Amaranthus tricolor]
MKKFLSITPYLHSLASIKELIAQNLHLQALKRTISLSSPSLTDQIYSLFIKSGHVLDTYLATSLITHFSNSSDFSRSLGFLFDTHNPDIVSFNALLSGYAKFNQSTPSFALCNMLTYYDLKPDKYTLTSLIKSCDSLDKIMIAHAICVKIGFNISGFVVSGLIHKYAKCGLVEYAEKCFEECLDFDCFVWTAMINGYVWNNEFDKGRMVFKGMRELGLELNEFSLTVVAGALREVREVEQIHGFAFKIGLIFGRSIYLSNVIMNMYSRCGHKLDALKVFDEIPNPDVVSWTARIGNSCDGDEALEVFIIMRLSNVEANELTLVNVLAAIHDPRLLTAGRQVHSLCYKAGYLAVISVGNALITMYGKCREMDDAFLVFDELVFHDSISWNSLIGGYSENGSLSALLSVYHQMNDIGVKPDQYTVASVLGVVTGPHYADFVLQFHSYIIKTGLINDDSMTSCLISSYGKCSCLDKAKRVFSTTKEITVGHLQVMAAAAVSAGFPADALECFISGMNSLYEMDGVTLSIIFKACSALTNLGQGKVIHCFALKSGIVRDDFVESAIVDFYCKCGSISDAQNIFIDVSRRNVAAWNAMIMGYAQHGCYNEVLSLFKRMEELIVKPDEITYLGILQSCCHVGLVNEANAHLNSMFELHGLVPCLEHYATMIDLLGRVGLVKEAWLIIDKMPVNPDPQVWQSLLSACHNSGNLEVGEVAAKELLKLQPENDSAFILLSNLYARAQNWDAVRRLRREMKEKLIYKEPGYSWTEVGGSVHQFLAEDTFHPDKERIYFFLHSIAQHMLPLSEGTEEYFCFCG